MHEMFHVDSIGNPPPNLPVLDLDIRLENAERTVTAYGAYYSKVLARVRTNAGFWAMQNSDNLVFYATSTYYTSLAGGYPSRPFAEDVPDGDPLYPPPGGASVFNFNNNTLNIQNASAFIADAVPISAATSTCRNGTVTNITSTVTLVDISHIRSKHGLPSKLPIITELLEINLVSRFGNCRRRFTNYDCLNATTACEYYSHIVVS